MSGNVQVSRSPASQNHPCAPTTGVREAPRHEIAGRKGLGFAAADLWGFEKCECLFSRGRSPDFIPETMAGSSSPLTLKALNAAIIQHHIFQ